VRTPYYRGSSFRLRNWALLCDQKLTINKHQEQPGGSRVIGISDKILVSGISSPVLPLLRATDGSSLPQQFRVHKLTRPKQTSLR